MVTKIDLKKELKYLYAPSAKKVEIVNVPEFNFVMIDGQIEPGETPEHSPAFREAMMAVYGLSFTLKFISKLRKQNPIDYSVMAVEGLWWVDSGEFDFRSMETWNWTLLMMQPKHITEDMYQEALRQLKQKKDNPALSRLRLETFNEGLCIQIMHIGPYAEEPKTLDRMKAFTDESGYIYCGKHHEIYLGDPRRAKPERLQTILRRPIEKTACL